MRDSSFYGEAGFWLAVGKKDRRENGKQSWHLQQVYFRPWQWALENRTASKAGSTHGRRKHKRGRDKQTWRFKAPSLLLSSLEDKGSKNGIILLSGSLNPAGQSEDCAWEQFVQPLSQSIRDKKCRPRSATDIVSWRWKEDYQISFCVFTCWFFIRKYSSFIEGPPTLLLTTDDWKHFKHMLPAKKTLTPALTCALLLLIQRN